ncbi:MAG: hypothetical protein KDI52_10230 [Xanthomonadales bacterium]|nr:hypothetical protein [Xanthomonadales bacterium]
MSLYQLELRHFFRSPLIWIIMSISAFIGAWTFLMAIELFSVIQVKFAGMSDAPTIVQAVVFPVISSQAKISMIIVAIISGLSFARLQQQNGWFLIFSIAKSEWNLTLQKYLGGIVIVLLFLLPAFIAMLALIILADLQMKLVITALLGLILFVCWLSALGVMISSWVNNSGFAILLNILVFFGLWGMSLSVLDASWGKNWLQSFSPNYHLQNFMSEVLPYSSIIYFLSGIVIFLIAASIRINHRRYLLN